MEAVLITHKGAEDIAAKEVEELIGCKSKICETAVKFKIKTFLDLCSLTYRSQTAIRILYLLSSFDIGKGFETLEKQIMKIDFSEWLGKDQTFKVECKRIGEHDFTSNDVASQAGEYVIKNIKKNQGYTQKTDMINPDVRVYVYLHENDCYVGIDFSGFDLSKRDYKIISYTPSIKGTIAYILLRIADYKKGNVLVDPFSPSGIISIEAALYLIGKSVNYFRKNEFAFNKLSNLNIKFENFFSDHDKISSNPSATITCLDDQFRHIKAAKGNSKIAGVNKHINFSRVNVEWLDTKFDKESVDIIVSNAPRISSINKKVMEKFYNELFYQAKFIFNKKGKVALLCNDIEIIVNASKKHNFNLVHERSIWQGKQELKIAVFEKIFNRPKKS